LNVFDSDYGCGNLASIIRMAEKKVVKLRSLTISLNFNMQARAISPATALLITACKAFQSLSGGCWFDALNKAD